MRKQRLTPVGIAFAVAIMMVVALLVRSSLHRPPRVVLPAAPVASDPSASAQSTQTESVRRVTLNAETVQDAVATLARPASYSRTLRLERFYSGGSGTSTAAVRVSNGWTRLDLTESGGTRHVITGEGKSYVWYDGEKGWFTGTAALSADEEQSIPTYEDILLLEQERIAAADYRMLDDTECIYVETAAEAGYSERYWVSVGSGLLFAAERLYGDETIYRMSDVGVESAEVTAEAFTLPDGTVLHTP